MNKKTLKWVAVPAVTFYIGVETTQTVLAPHDSSRDTLPAFAAGLSSTSDTGVIAYTHNAVTEEEIRIEPPRRPGITFKSS